MPYIKPKNNQSNYDLCLKAYGGFDKFIQFLRDNQISDANIVEKKDYFFDQNLIVNKNFTGGDYISGKIN